MKILDWGALRGTEDEAIGGVELETVGKESSMTGKITSTVLENAWKVM